MSVFLMTIYGPNLVDERAINADAYQIEYGVTASNITFSKDNKAVARYTVSTSQLAFSIIERRD